jgi:hypothetical protein
MRGEAGCDTDYDADEGRCLEHIRDASFHAKPYKRANIVSNNIICPTSVSGSRQLIRFQKVLPTTEANMATAMETPANFVQARAEWEA